MPQYVKTTWVNGSSPAINATNLNKIEDGIFASITQDGSTSMSGQFVTISGSATTLLEYILVRQMKLQLQQVDFQEWISEIQDSLLVQVA